MVPNSSKGIYVDMYGNQSKVAVLLNVCLNVSVNEGNKSNFRRLNNYLERGRKAYLPHSTLALGF